MLNLIFQKAKAKNPDNVWCDSRWFFNNHFKDEWFNDKFVQRVVSDIDNVTVTKENLLLTSEGVYIPKQNLSTGTKTVLCIYKFPDLIFNVTQTGDNAFEFVIALSLCRNVTVLVYRQLPYNMLKLTKVYKDYSEISLENEDDFEDEYEDWLEEIYND